MPGDVPAGRCLVSGRRRLGRGLGALLAMDALAGDHLRLPGGEDPSWAQVVLDRAAAGGNEAADLRRAVEAIAGFVPPGFVPDVLRTLGLDDGEAEPTPEDATP